MATGSKVGAYAQMAWRIVRHAAAQPFREPEGLDRFRRFYASDRVARLSANEQAALARHSRCIGCGLCEAWADPPVEPADPRRYDHAMSRPLALSRDLSTSWAGAEHLADAPPAAAAEACPMGVPLDEMTVFLRRVNRRLDDEEEQR